MSPHAQHRSPKAPWPLLALVLWGCVPAGELPGLELAERTSPVALPLTCPAGVSICSGAGAEQVGWQAVSISGTGRVEAAQVFEVPARGWPGVVRLVLKRDAPGSKATALPKGVVEVRAASAQQAPGSVAVARGTFDVKALPCTGSQLARCDGAATVVDVPLLPVRGAAPLQPGKATRPQLYVVTVSLEGPAGAQLGLALHGESTGKRLFVGGSSRPSPAASWGPTRWSERTGATAVAAFALALEWERVPSCTDNEQNGDETSVDCGGGCPACAPGKACSVDADCRVGSTCRQGLCAQLAPPGSACTRGAECKSGLCGAGGSCRPATCANGKKDGDERGVDCGGSCDGCGTGAACAEGDDCASGSCTGTPGTCQAARCDDGVRALGESDVDCGGDCGPCEKGKRCKASTDCATGACSRGTCQSASCRNGAQDGRETDVDCGGGICPACAPGKACTASTDCASGVCTEGTCAEPGCSDGVKNGAEVDVDCGGRCQACAPGQACLSALQCASRVCGPSKTCADPSCQDRVPNGQETDVDCGGTCAPCVAQKACAADADCQSGLCAGGKCEVAACTDGLKGTGETDVDCGGPCRTKCQQGASCRTHLDCVTGICANRTCVTGTCTDKLRSDEETDVDCGGTACGPCGPGRRCALNADCASRTCVGGLCRAPSCTDGLPNGTETGTDCGGACGPCAPGGGCLVAADCTSQVCGAGMCQVPAGTDGVRNGQETDVDCGGKEVPARCAPGRRCSTSRDCYRNAACQQNVCVCPPGAVCKDAVGGPSAPSPNATCSSVGNANVCTCLPGFTGDGYTCDDVDECAAGTLTCSPDEVCINAPGTARCDCPAGYERSGTACVDVDECAAGACDVNATCSNTPGGFACACNAPDWMGDGGTCVPFNTPPRLSGVQLPSRVDRSGPATAMVGGATDAEGDAVVMEWQWKIDGAVVPEATGSSLERELFARGQRLTVTVTPFDGKSRGAPVSASVVVSNAPPPIPTVAFVAPWAPGTDLVCQVTSASTDADGDALTHRFTWTLNGVTVSGANVDAMTSKLPAALAGDGGWIECQAVPDDGYEVNSGRTVQAFFDSPCTWTEIARWPLDALPSGSQTRNGGYAGQWAAAVGGRTAWTQQSDWNQAFIPSPALASDDILAVSVDVNWTSGSRMALGQRLQTAGYNDVIRGYDFSYDGSSGTSMTSYAPTSTRSICCSAPVTSLGTRSVSPLTVGSWHSMRVEHRQSTQRVKGQLDGVPALSVTGTLNWGGSSIKLDSGRGCCSSGYVAFSNLVLERGTVGCFKSNRSPCASNSECSSGYCVGGVCCSSACTGANQTCTRPGSVGTCVMQ